MTAVDAAPQLPGPNEPCFCGSGQKFKKCHRDRLDGVTVPHGRRRLRPGAVSPRRAVPPHIPRPDYAESGTPSQTPGPLRSTPEQIVRLRRAGHAAAEVLRFAARLVRPGITTDEIDALTHDEYVRLGGYPSTLNYYGYRKALCTSVNEVVCHGIPDDRPLAEGDIVNLDISIFLGGVHGDTSATVAVGQVDEASRRLIRVNREGLERGIQAVRPGALLNEIGRAIELHTTKHGYSVVRDYLGHGIGERFHADLQVPHYFDPAATTRLEPGMVFTIEPMINEGTWRVQHWNDEWTVVTADGQRSAQCEHMVLVTENGVDVLTA